MDVAKSAEDLEFKQESTFFELLRKHTYAKFYEFVFVGFIAKSLLDCKEMERIMALSG